MTSSHTFLASVSVLSLLPPSLLPQGCGLAEAWASPWKAGGYSAAHACRVARLEAAGLLRGSSDGVG